MIPADLLFVLVSRKEGEEIILICYSVNCFALFETTGQFVRKKLLDGELAVVAV